MSDVTPSPDTPATEPENLPVIPSPTNPTPTVERSRWFPGGSGFNSIRDLMLFALGVGVLIQQVFFSREINTVIISVGAAAAGLPVVLRTDSKSK